MLLLLFGLLLNSLINAKLCCERSEDENELEKLVEVSSVENESLLFFLVSSLSCSVSFFLENKLNKLNDFAFNFGRCEVVGELFESVSSRMLSTNSTLLIPAKIIEDLRNLRKSDSDK